MNEAGDSEGIKRALKVIRKQAERKQGVRARDYSRGSEWQT